MQPDVVVVSILCVSLACAAGSFRLVEHTTQRFWYWGLTVDWKKLFSGVTLHQLNKWDLNPAVGPAVNSSLLPGTNHVAT